MKLFGKIKILIAAVILFFAVSHFTFSESSSEFEISTDPRSNQYIGSIYGDIVIWVNESNGNWDIYGYNLSTEKEFQITTDPASQSQPAIYGDIVVWTDERSGHGDIYGYSFSTEKEFQITTGWHYQSQPAIYGDIVVWVERRWKNVRNDFDRDIYGHSLSTNEEFQITTDPNDQQNPAIYGDVVVFDDFRNDNKDIYGYNLSTNEEFQITTDPNDQQNPAIYGDVVVWTDYRNGNYDIYGYNLSSFDLAEEFAFPLEFGNFRVGDINGDGENEIVMIDYNRLVVLDDRGKELWMKELLSLKNAKEKAWISCLVDVNGDSASEIILNYPPGNLRLEVYDGRGGLLKSFDFTERFKEYGNKTVPDDGGISVKTVMDINSDGSLEVIATVHAEYRRKPRGVFVFDYETAEELWYYPIANISRDSYYIMGKFPHICGITDLDNNGTLDIIVTTFASCNGVTEDRTDDCHCYVIVLDAYGNELFIKEIGEYFTGVNVGIDDIDNDGYKEIVGAVFHAVNVWGKLFVLDFQGNLLSDTEFDYSVVWGGIADFEDDGYKEIVVASSQGKVAIYDYHLNMLDEHVIGTSDEIVYPAIIEDINKDSSKEIIVVSQGFNVIILDQNFNVLWKKHFENAKYVSLPVAMTLSREGYTDSLLILADNLHLYPFVIEPYPSTLQMGEVQQDIHEKLNSYRRTAEIAFINKEFSLSEDYYQKMYDLYNELGNEEEKNRIYFIIITIKLSLADSLFDNGIKYLEQGDCQEAMKVLQEALTKYQELDNTQKIEEIIALISKCSRCEDASKGVIEASALVSEADKLMIQAKERKREHEYLESKDKIDFALGKYDEALKKIRTALQIYEKIGSSSSVEQISIYLMEIEIKKKDAKEEKKSINYNLITWYGSILIVFIIVIYWVYLLSCWFYKLEKPKLLSFKKMKKEGFSKSIKRKRRHSVLGAAFIACFFIIFGTGSLPIIFLIGLFSASSFIYTFLLGGEKEAKKKRKAY